MTTTSAPTPATPSRSRAIIAITLAIIAALVVAFFIFASLYADWLWYDQLGLPSVLLTQWIARVVMFVVGFLGMARARSGSRSSSPIACAPSTRG